MKFTKIPANAFETIQLNAGILVDSFDVDTLEIGNILGATSGGINFAVTDTFKDFGDDIDNCPKNTKEMKVKTDTEAKMSGSFATITAGLAKNLIAGADVDADDSSHIIPRVDLADSDFSTIWFIGDYSDVNTGANAGFIAIKMTNALNTGGFKMQTTDKEKGKFAFEFLAHFSINAQETVPYEMWVRQGGEPVVNPSVMLDKHTITIKDGDTFTLHAVTNPASQTVTWTSSDGTKASVAAGVVTGEAEGSAIITAKITVDSVDYTDTCTVIVEAAEE